MAQSATCRSPSAGLLFSALSAQGMDVFMDHPAAGSKAKADARDLVALLASIADGDRQALRSLYDRTSAKLYGVCLRLLGDAAEAQDVLQEVYLTVWHKAQRFESSKASAITWLTVLSRNKSIDRLRRKRGGNVGLEAAAEIADDAPSALQVVEEAEDRARLMHCLDELDERPRAMIRAAFLDGATYPELATREGVPLATMKSWIRRGLLRLRGCMER
jgi:RNA polymerase sigma-70 factor, ECF subfamily